MILKDNLDKQALLIENTETKILEISKNAVLYMWTKEQFKKAIDEEINKLLENLVTDDLKEKVKSGLRLYAQKVYAKELQILKEHAGWFALITVAGMRGDKKAYNFQRRFLKEFDKEFIQSPRIQASVNEKINEYMGYYEHRIPLDEYHKEYMQRVAKVTRDLIESNAKEDYTTNVSLRNIAEMTVRYEHQTEMVDKLKSEGVKLVYIVPHANCSKRCEKYQVGGSSHKSGLYSLDGTRGHTKEDNIYYVPLEFATNNPVDRYVTKAGKVYQNGCITGFNCRHKLEAYKPHIKPKPIPEKVIEKERAIEERQREFERTIRQCKKAYVLNKGVNKEKAGIWREKARKINKEYENFSRKNKVAFYPERTALLDDDKII